MGIGQQGQLILFWKEEYPAITAAKKAGGFLAAAGFMAEQLDRRPRPQDRIDTTIPRERREAVAKILAAGNIGMAYMGFAECRICGVRLGTRDFYGHGFVWPEKAEHYVLEHDVWVPELNDLIYRARK
jgi:hypothetical protein